MHTTDPLEKNPDENAPSPPEKASNSVPAITVQSERTALGGLLVKGTETHQEQSAEDEASREAEPQKVAVLLPERSAVPHRPQHPSLAVRGMLQKPLEKLDANLRAIENIVPELTTAVAELKKTQQRGPALRTPEDFRQHSAALAEIEERCCAALVKQFVKLAELLVRTHDYAGDAARYTPDESADPHPPLWKRAINAMLPYGGVRSAVNSVAGTSSYVAGMVGTGVVLAPALASAAAPIMAAIEGVIGPTAAIVPNGAIYFCIGLATAIAGIIGGGAGSYAYGACNVVFDKCISPILSGINKLVFPATAREGEDPQVTWWKQALNASFTAAKNRSKAVFDELDGCLRDLADLRANVSTLITNARAVCAEDAKRTGRNEVDWKKEDDELRTQAEASEQETRENTDVVERFEGLQKMTEGVGIIDPLSVRDLLNRGFQGTAKICGFFKNLGEVHFIFPGGMPSREPLKTLYILLGGPAAPIAKLGSFTEALNSDGAKPVRMLHELLEVVLAKLRLKKQEGITMKHLALAAFNPKDWDLHGPLYYLSGGTTNASLMINVKSLPYIEMANEMRELSPESARHSLSKKMGDIAWSTHASRSLAASVTGIVTDAASVGGEMLANGTRRVFQDERARMAGEERRAGRAAEAAQADVEKFAAMHTEVLTHDTKTNAQLGDEIRTQIKAMHPEDNAQAHRIETLIEYWEKRREVEALQRTALETQHAIALHEIDQDLPSLLAGASTLRNVTVEGILQKAREFTDGSIGSYIPTLASIVAAADQLAGPTSGDRDPRVRASLDEINTRLVQAQREQFSGLPFPKENTILGSTPLGALLVYRVTEKADTHERSGKIFLLPPTEADAYIDRQIQESQSLPHALLSDEATLQTLASRAVGRPGPLPRQQRDALRQMQIAGDTVAAGPRMEKLFSKAEREGIIAPNGSHPVLGLQHLFAQVRKRTQKKSPRSRMLLGDV